MAWADDLPVLSPDSLTTLARWALGEKPSILATDFTAPNLPDAALAAGPGGLIDHVIAHRPDTEAGRYWNALVDTSELDVHAARAISNAFFSSIDWRPGFAIAALRALDTRTVWDADGILLGLEVARGLLLHPGTVAQIKLRADLAEHGTLDTPLAPRHSPFSDRVVQETLACLDAVVAAQERQEDRGPQVLADLKRFGPQPLELLGFAQALFKTPVLSPPNPVGSRLAMLLRALMEEALNRQRLDLVKAIDRPLSVVAARYGFTRDAIHAAHRCATTNAMVHGDMATAATVAVALEHFLAGALVLADPELEATVHHGLALVLRSGARKIPGKMDAVPHLQRSITVRRQLGEELAAIGAQIDLASVLIELSPFAGMLADAPPEVEQWESTAATYLADAIDRLAEATNPVARSYLGEAFSNRSRLHLATERRAEAADDAQAALAIAEETGNDDLKARALLVLGQAAPDPARALDHQAAAARSVQAVRKRIADEQLTVAWVGNKEGLFAAQLDYLLTRASEVMDEASICRALVDALEEGRGLTFNRWIGVEKNAGLDDAREALRAAADTVVALYAVAARRIGLVRLAADEPPQLYLIDMTSADVDRLVESHLTGLTQQSWTRLPLWAAVQQPLAETGPALVSALEPDVAAGKTILLVPHRGLHALALHTLPTTSGGTPIGLRTPVFTNASLTNWLVAHRRAGERAEPGAPDALVAAAWPAREQEDARETATVSALLRDAGLAVQQLGGETAALERLAADGGTWRVLHLGCHGVFREERSIYGLLLAANGQAPPPPVGEIGATSDFLATPARLRDARLAGRLTFLSSCVSARSFTLPGDDLMGITRALFANGALDLVAGGWTVLSTVVEAFARAFYEALRDGRSTAAAMLAARQHLAETQPDPFFWGCLVHQGANGRPLRKEIP
jgi:CHAT domain-containing protein